MQVVPRERHRIINRFARLQIGGFHGIFVAKFLLGRSLDLTDC
jgi:hypothetical protein